MTRIQAFDCHTLWEGPLASPAVGDTITLRVDTAEHQAEWSVTVRPADQDTVLRWVYNSAHATQRLFRDYELN